MQDRFKDADIFCTRIDTCLQALCLDFFQKKFQIIHCLVPSHEAHTGDEAAMLVKEFIDIIIYKISKIICKI